MALRIIIIASLNPHMVLDARCGDLNYLFSNIFL